MVNYFIWFLSFSVIGWCIDTFYRSINQKKYAPGDYLPLFAPEYGVGGVLLLLVFDTSLHSIVKVIIGTFLVCVVEYLAGSLYLLVFKKRFWDYSKNRFNLQGHVDALHCIYWLLFTSIAYFVFPIFF